MKFYKNAVIVALREYARSYGGEITIEADYMTIDNNEVVIYDSFGRPCMVYRKNTKRFVKVADYGTELSQHGFKSAIGKMQKKFEQEKAKQRLEERLQKEKDDKEQLHTLAVCLDNEDFLKAHKKRMIEKYGKFSNKIATYAAYFAQQKLGSDLKTTTIRKFMKQI